MRRKKWLILLAIVSMLTATYAFGPQPEPPVLTGTLPAVPTDPDQLEQFIAAGESLHRLKPDNEAKIIWADSLRRKTPVSIVYLHGFSASRMEGDPVHRDIARRFGANLYMARLDGHGIDTSDALYNMTASGLLRDARQALAIGRALGDKVILVGCSTGSTLALTLAARFPREVYAVVNLSANVAINQPMIALVDAPWGLQITRMVSGGDYMVSKPKYPDQPKYWYNKYRLEAIVELQNLVDNTMLPSTFATIHQPVLNLYYYKNEQEQDPTVKVSAILEMHGQLGTPAALKRAVAIPDAGAHVIGSSITSKDVAKVEEEMTKFLVEVLKLAPVGVNEPARY
ncbi:alpha/beta hydrolase [Chitinophaga horti]|uniref:Alpha/beta hydrolase n=1 Tax=Chitinophaga horti TaxID=2920382 RepID=A0ABY6J500_9BACT|nr:alpha/beta hydrolase [Chitinophaga horti]UYQ94759.1 alpha/beta hydrolase [Chitinophaga horti]